MLNLDVDESEYLNLKFTLMYLAFLAGCVSMIRNYLKCVLLNPNQLVLTKSSDQYPHCFPNFQSDWNYMITTGI